MYDTNWFNSGQVVLDQVSPASDAVTLVDNDVSTAGISTEYARGDHQHPLQVSSVLPQSDTAQGEAGTANTYARSDNTHHVNLNNDVPLKNSETGTAGTTNIYANATHQYPLNVDLSDAKVPLVNVTAEAGGTSDYYCRNDHVHPQQLTYDGNITATKFIKTGGTVNDILLANGDTKKKSILEAGTIGNNDQNPLGFTIVKVGQEGQVDRGLCISADGHTLTFNGQIIAGTGAANASVNYSQGNLIVQGVNSPGTDSGFYSNGTNIFWSSHALQFDPYYQEQ
ncbi:MAG: hypothetical protein EZS28_006202 [Streblomastix strix]|uniref:Uncharacterized protein n=1 Tax=Streblomastix strix TaxID=222440 RepID=A0A5J4WTP0_9EUKA|nr:MAG: hypothetical protein EZS28_006202 [Streblomastix strix]